MYYLNEVQKSKAEDMIMNFPVIEEAYPEAGAYLLSGLHNSKAVV